MTVPSPRFFQRRLPLLSPLSRHRCAGRALRAASVLTGAILLAVPFGASAQTSGGAYGTVPAAPSGVLQLDAATSQDVPSDEIHITLFTERQGNDPSALSQGLNQQTAQALRLARAQSAVQVRTGTFSLTPSTDRDGKLVGWRGRSELIIDSSDFDAASTLAGQMGNLMQVADVSFSLSAARRRQVESTLSDSAIAAFRQKAGAAANAFGYHGFSIREVQLGYGMDRPRMAFHALAATPVMAKMAPVPVEGGTSTVTVTVNGSVQMTP